jgi:hypothetical protein
MFDVPAPLAPRFAVSPPVCGMGLDGGAEAVVSGAVSGPPASWRRSAAHLCVQASSGRRCKRDCSRHSAMPTMFRYLWKAVSPCNGPQKAQASCTTITLPPSLHHTSTPNLHLHLPPQHLSSRCQHSFAPLCPRSLRFVLVRLVFFATSHLPLPSLSSPTIPQPRPLMSSWFLYL